MRQRGNILFFIAISSSILGPHPEFIPDGAQEGICISGAIAEVSIALGKHLNSCTIIQIQGII